MGIADFLLTSIFEGPVMWASGSVSSSSTPLKTNQETPFTCIHKNIDVSSVAACILPFMLIRTQEKENTTWLHYNTAHIGKVLGVRVLKNKSKGCFKK